MNIRCHVRKAIPEDWQDVGDDVKLLVRCEVAEKETDLNSLWIVMPAAFGIPLV